MTNERSEAACQFKEYSFSITADTSGLPCPVLSPTRMDNVKGRASTGPGWSRC